MEMAKLDAYLPRYYDGFDVDEILQKVKSGLLLTEDERIAIGAAREIYYGKYFEESHRRAEEWIKAHPGEYRVHVDPQRTDKR